MMTTLRIANELAAVLVPIGFVAAGLALVCAIVAGVAVMSGAGGLVGGAVGAWVPFALLSVSASFASQWLPLVIAVGGLVAMLVLGGIVRSVVNASSGARRRRPSVAPAVETGPGPVLAAS